ncbi:MAG: primosomal protein N' [Chlamydiae bacterium]|nr:primosomal protein N' [Chlamydiota bacterium]
MPDFATGTKEVAKKHSFALVVIDTIDTPLDYSIPDTFVDHVTIGTRVEVPVRGSTRTGTVILLKSHSNFDQVQPISAIISSNPLIPQQLIDLAHWMANYYICPLRKTLKIIFPPAIRNEVKAKTQFFIKPLLSQRKLIEVCQSLRLKNPAQALVIDLLLQSKKGIFLSDLLEKLGSKSAVQTLSKKKILSLIPIKIGQSPFSDVEYFPTRKKKLSDQQKNSLDEIQKSLIREKFNVHLVHGITGSGKTEIFLQAMEYALSIKKTVIYLVPEIALTSQTIERIKSRFQIPISVLHHRLSQGEKCESWHLMREGKMKIVLGARSAIFSPMINLGLIIVDEEHESSYKQSEEAPRYHARDVAIMRGKISNATVVLASATPSLESYYNAKNGKYKLHFLTQRADNAKMAKITIVDMKPEFEKAKRFTLFSEKLISSIQARYKAGEQTILFLNRRGYHTSAFCPLCSYMANCPHCDINLTYHLGNDILACHLCDFRTKPFKTCPSCGKEEQIKYKGAGTELVERALHALFPDIRTLRLDADTTRHKGSIELLFKQFRTGKADLLIGTQMVAKGFHFPNVTLVGVLNADRGLHIPDFRASENLLQQLIQVSGRSGRGPIEGEVIIQTSLPDHEIIQFAKTQDYEKFFNWEIEIRKKFSFPPFTRLIKFVFSGEQHEEVLKYGNHFREKLIQSLPSIYEIHPIIACGHAKVKNSYRFQFLIKGNRINNLFQKIAEAQNGLKKNPKIRVSIDVDPISTY